MSTASGRRWMGKVARVGCVLCARMGYDGTPALVHHVKFGQGASDRGSDFMTAALCEPHHVGPDGVHQLKERGLRLRYNCSELDLIADTVQAIEEQNWAR